MAAKDVPGSSARAGAVSAVERSGLERGEEVAGFRRRGKESQTLEGWAWKSAPRSQALETVTRSMRVVERGAAWRPSSSGFAQAEAMGLRRAVVRKVNPFARTLGEARNPTSACWVKETNGALRGESRHEGEKP
jgi:hypothetical protein